MLLWNRAFWDTWQTYAVAISFLCIILCLLLIFVLFCRYKCKSRCFYAHSSYAVCSTNTWEKSGGKSCRVVSASVCWQIQRMKDWTWICYGVASSKSRLKSLCFFFFSGALWKRTFTNIASELNTEDRFASVTSNRQHGRCREEHWEKLKFLRRKYRRLLMTSN